MPQSPAYSLPAFYQGSSSTNKPGSEPQSINTGSTPPAIVIAELLIPNWTSDGFGKFVEACKAIVDELANSQNSSNGAKELKNAEEVFGQVIWLWKQIWPAVADLCEDYNVDMEIVEMVSQHLLLLDRVAHSCGVREQ